MEVSKTAICEASKYVYGDSTIHISFSQLTDIILRLYGDGPDSGPLRLDGSKMKSILTSILGKNATDAALISDNPSFKKKLLWYYDINKGESYIQAK